MMLDLAAACRLVAHYQRVQGLLDWTYDVSLVPGLKFQGGDAWAVVDPDPRQKRAKVQIRDIGATPIPGFDGDPMLELRITVSHELWHCWTAPVFNGTTNPVAINYEEQFVEAAARAVVLSEGTIDARVMARSVKAIPSRIRARLASVSALASRRRIAGRNETVADPKQLAALAMKGGALAAKEGLDPEVASFIEEVVAALAGGHAEPDGDEGAAAARDAEAEVDTGAPDARGAYARDAEPPEMARARKAINTSLGKARRAEVSAAQIATRARVKELRSDGVQIDDATAAKLVALGDIDAAEERLSWLLKGRETTTARARSGAEVGSSPNTSDGPGLDVEALVKEGFPRSLAVDLAAQHKIDPMGADVQIKSARARLGNVVDIEAQRARQNGGR